MFYIYWIPQSGLNYTMVNKLKKNVLLVTYNYRQNMKFMKPVGHDSNYLTIHIHQHFLNPKKYSHAEVNDFYMRY
jgi:hypothetical protein